MVIIGEINTSLTIEHSWRSQHLLIPSSVSHLLDAGPPAPLPAVGGLTTRRGTDERG